MLVYVCVSYAALISFLVLSHGYAEAGAHMGYTGQASYTGYAGQASKMGYTNHGAHQMDMLAKEITWDTLKPAMANLSTIVVQWASNMVVLKYVI